MRTPDWQSDDGSVTLYCGDCLDILPTLPPGSVDSVVTDPPYGIAFQSAWRTESERFEQIANDEAPFIWWAYPAARLLGNGGCVLSFCRWDHAEAFRQAFIWAGLDVKAQCVWDRGNHGLGDLKGTPAPRHDLVWFATKGRFLFCGRRPNSILSHMRVNADSLRHPNEKPEPLIIELVEDYSPPDGLLLDPFLGSGTTAIAAIRAGRRFIGIEIEPKYFEIAKRRIQEEIDRFALLEPVRPKEPERMLLEVS